MIPLKPVDAAAKVRELEAQERDRQHNKAVKRKYRECFWTRPYGHVYVKADDLFSRCVGCGKFKWSGG